MSRESTRGTDHLLTAHSLGGNCQVRLTWSFSQIHTKETEKGTLQTSFAGWK